MGSILLADLANSSGVCRDFGLYHSTVLNRCLDESHDLWSWEEDWLRSDPQGAAALDANLETLLSSLEKYSISSLSLKMQLKARMHPLLRHPDPAECIHFDRHKHPSPWTTSSPGYSTRHTEISKPGRQPTTLGRLINWALNSWYFRGCLSNKVLEPECQERGLNLAISVPKATGPSLRTSSAESTIKGMAWPCMGGINS